MELRFVFLISITIIGCFLFLLSCATESSHPSVLKLKNLVFQSMPSSLNRFLGPKISHFFSMFRVYLCYSNNPLTAIFYCTLIPSCYYLYFTRIISPFADELGPINIILGHIVLSLAVLSYILTMVTDPGTITKQNVEESVRKYDKFSNPHLFPAEKICSACQLPK